MVKVPRKDEILWNTVSRMWQRKYVDGRHKREVTLWWNERVAEVIKRKKEGYKKWRKDRSEENLEAYKVLKKEAR